MNPVYCPDNYVHISFASQDVTSLMRSAIAPLLSSIGDALEAIVLTMHNEDFAA